MFNASFTFNKSGFVDIIHLSILSRQIAKKDSLGIDEVTKNVTKIIVTVSKKLQYPDVTKVIWLFTLMINARVCIDECINFNRRIMD